MYEISVLKHQSMLSFADCAVRAEVEIKVSTKEFSGNSSLAVVSVW